MKKGVSTTHVIIVILILAVIIGIIIYVSPKRSEQESRLPSFEKQITHGITGTETGWDANSRYLH